jgi:hypothetical protein
VEIIPEFGPPGPEGFEHRVAFFFHPPQSVQTGLVSPLHLIRREIQDCLIGEIVDESVLHTVPRRRHRLFCYDDGDYGWY